MLNKNIRMSSFRSRENIQKKEDLKSVKMHFFLVIPKFWGFKKSTTFFTGFIFFKFILVILRL